MPQLPIQSPTGGVNRVVNREGQPPNTCWDALNVVPFDRYGRKRVSQRNGLAKWSSTQLASSKIQGMIQVPGLTYSATVASTVSIPIASFSHVPASVSTSSGTVSYPANYVPSLASDIVVVNSTVGYGTSLTFNLTFTGASTVNAANDFYVALSSGSTTTTNILTQSDPVDVLFQYNPQAGVNQITVTIGINNAGGFSSYSISSTGTFTLGQAIPCSVVIDGAGKITAAMGALTPPVLNLTSTAASSSTLCFLGETASDMAESATSLSLLTGTTVATGQVGYKSLLVAVAAGNVFFGDLSGNVTQIAYSGVPSTARINSTNYVSMCYAGGMVFIADGSSTLWSVNVSSTTLNGIASSTVTSTTAVVSPFATSSTIQPVPPNCILACTWRGRVVLAGDSGNSAVWYMSRPMGQYASTNTFVFAGTEWDFSQSDPAAAVFGSNAGATGITEPITALIPFSNDYLKFGCAHSLFMCQGDPAAGGAIVNVSQNIGVVGKDAWTIDPQGTLYFVASGGLYSCRPAWEFYRPPEPVTLFNVDQNFIQLDPGVSRTTLVFDPDLHYLHVFLSAPALSGTQGQHLTMDARSVGQEGPPAFWPQTFVSTAGPAASLVFFADGNPNHRTILMGGNDGYIRSWTSTALDDDGTAISAGITFGPFAPAGPDMAATIQGVTIDMGETPVGLSSTTFGAVAKLAIGPDAYSVTEFLGSGVDPKPIPVIAMTLDRRQKTFRQRLRGGWFSLALASVGGSQFSFESAVVDFVPAGKNRERRQ